MSHGHPWVSSTPAEVSRDPRPALAWQRFRMDDGRIVVRKLPSGVVASVAVHAVLVALVYAHEPGERPEPELPPVAVEIVPVDPPPLAVALAPEPEPEPEPAPPRPEAPRRRRAPGGSTSAAAAAPPPTSGSPRASSIASRAAPTPIEASRRPASSATRAAGATAPIRACSPRRSRPTAA